ncbi:MAG: efflux RND transporter permease subunit [Actinomycetaceae bacterium]|nr:efflux RND transporter permease subunit [Arcanobacterium sp.]MDD7505272.1 efflux RND transporter permease subunit [Actinomycetaceae bacterium]MDY6144035.1 efflux RND transporter permease subunit [Arcanobacterium sp.]
MFNLAKVSLKNRAFVVLVTLVIAVLGAFSMLTLKQELIPSVELPRIAVVTVSPGATSEQMKDRVSLPIEQQVAQLPEVENTSTQSSSSMSVVDIELTYGTDLARATSKVELAASRAKSTFPEGAEPQVISGGTSSIPLSYVAVTSEGEPLEVAQRIRSAVVPEIQKVAGISSVQMIGAPTQVVNIGVDQARVAELEISNTAIQDALENNGLSVPVGALTNADSTVNVTVGKKLSSVEELRDLPVQGPAQQITLPDGTTQDGPPAVYPLSEIATVELSDGDNPMVGRLDGREALALLIYPTANANLVETSNAVNAKLDSLRESVGGNTEFSALFEQAPYITQSVRSLAEEGAIGLAFAVAVILIFLTSVRSTLVTAISVPLSLLTGFIGMLIFGYTINMLTLAALTLTIGRVVDDSIVVIENIKRHLEYGKTKREAIIDAVREVASAVTASTFVSFIVFLPIGLVSGLVGELFKPFAFTVVIALSSSLFVSLTIVPVLAYWFLKPSREARIAALGGEQAIRLRRTEVEAQEDRYWLRTLYRPAFRLTQKYAKTTVVIAVAVLAGTLALIPALKMNLLGSTNQGMVTLTQNLKPGTSIDAKLDSAADVEAAFASVPEVKSVATIIPDSNARGADAAIATGMGGGGSADSISYLLSVDAGADLTSLTDRLVAVGSEAAGGEGDSVEAATQNLLGSGTVDVDIRAGNDDDLARAVEAVENAVTNLDDVKSVSSNLKAAAPAVQITVDRNAAAERGLTENDLVGLIAAQMVEPNIGTITIDNIDTSIYLSIDDPVQTVDELRQLEVLGAPITDIAQVDDVLSIPSIVTKNGQTTATVSVTPASDDNIGELSRVVEQAVDSADLPDGAVTTMSGAAQMFADSFYKLILAILAAVLLIYVVLVWIFKSLIQPALLLISIPFAAIGSIIALLVTRTSLDLSAMVGVLMLTGIVVTNAVVLIDLINQYRIRGLGLSQAIEDGAMRRLRPIIMTALATIAAMVPMAFGFSSSSGFISQPLAITVIGGLISSTLLTLVLLPVLYRFVEGAKERRSSRREAREERELKGV